MAAGSFKSIARDVGNYRPNLISVDGKRQASVALILQNLKTTPEIFFIQRATNKDDPWSGQIAFPGGNRESIDEDSSQTAIRETFEEVGIRLNSEVLIGRIDDQQGRNNYQKIPLVINCFVFDLQIRSNAVNNYEVGDSFWVPLEYLTDENNKISYQTDYSPEPYPGIHLGNDRVLWGLTYRFVERFLTIIQ